MSQGSPVLWSILWGDGAANRLGVISDNHPTLLACSGMDEIHLSFQTEANFLLGS
jgi:hypothetical protein